MRPIAHAREHTGDRIQDRSQERQRQAADGLNEADAAIRAIARELRGVLPISMANGDYILTPEEAQYSRFRLLGAHTAIRTLRVPAEPDETAREIVILNSTTGGWGVVVAPSDGAATATVVAAATETVLLSSTGAEVL